MNRLSRFWGLVFIAAFFATLRFVAPTSGADLDRYQSRFYTIHTNLDRRDAVPFGRHMDLIFAHYQERFEQFHPRDAKTMPLYLFRAEQDYLRFMTEHGIDARNSGGMFFVTPRIQGLATWTRGRPRSRTFQVLQHEGFHQFAYHYIGPKLPVWVNEGLAQYFEDAVLIGSHMETGLADPHRLKFIQHAIRTRHVIDFDTLLGMSTDRWGTVLHADPQRASLLYAQSWSVVYFLIHGDDGRYQDAFEQYLWRLSNGGDPRQTFREVFGIDTPLPMARRWVRFAADQKPAPLNQAISRLEFLGSALAFLQHENRNMPDTLGELRDELERIGFGMTLKSRHGLKIELSAGDPDMYRFTRDNGGTGYFRLLAPKRRDLPPRLTAPGLSPQPILTWTRNDADELVQEIRYRQ